MLHLGNGGPGPSGMEHLASANGHVSHRNGTMCALRPIYTNSNQAVEPLWPRRLCARFAGLDISCYGLQSLLVAAVDLLDSG